MHGETLSQYHVGETVKLRVPADAREAAARFEIVELREPRVLIRLKCDLNFPPMENVLISDIQAAD